MSAPAVARRWTCGGCGVALGRIDGGKVPLPDSWERCAEGDFCLSCRRGRAADAAQAAVSGDPSAAVRAKARREGLIEFEVSRTPELTDTTIARACRTSTGAVAAARTRLQIGAAPAPGRTAAGPRGAARVPA